MHMCAKLLQYQQRKEIRNGEGAAENGFVSYSRDLMKKFKFSPRSHSCSQFELNTKTVRTCRRWNSSLSSPHTHTHLYSVNRCKLQFSFCVKKSAKNKVSSWRKQVSGLFITWRSFHINETGIASVYVNCELTHHNWPKLRDKNTNAHVCTCEYCICLYSTLYYVRILALFHFVLLCVPLWSVVLKNKSP